LIESIVNAFIDFIWSTLGIESIKDSPHIKLSSAKNIERMIPENVKRILDFIEPTSNSVIDLDGGIQDFIYEITLSGGVKKSYLNREDLDKFILENKDINFDFSFD
jgi:hypothetical protein